MISATVDWSPLEKDLADLEKYATSGKPEIVAGKRMKKNILIRSEGHVDADGKRFAKYVPAYEKYGRIAKGYGVNPDIRREGYLLESLGMQSKDTFGVEDSQYKKAQGVSKKRKFIGATDNDAKQVADDIVKDLND